MRLSLCIINNEALVEHVEPSPRRGFCTQSYLPLEICLVCKLLKTPCVVKRTIQDITGEVQELERVITKPVQLINSLLSLKSLYKPFPTTQQN
jgi:hypothetical protein